MILIYHISVLFDSNLFYSFRGLFENWRLPPFTNPTSPLSSDSLRTLHPHPAGNLPTHSPSCLARAASHHPVDRTLMLLCCLLTHITYIHCLLFYRKSFRSNNSSLSRCSDKLVASYFVSWINASYCPNP